MNERYAGKPLLLLLELYVLWAIDELPEKSVLLVQQMTPYLQSAYKMSGTWQEIISAVMEFPESLPGALRKLWAENCSIAEEHRTRLDPQIFAEMVADRNFLS